MANLSEARDRRWMKIGVVAGVVAAVFGVAAYAEQTAKPSHELEAQGFAINTPIRLDSQGWEAGADTPRQLTATASAADVVIINTGEAQALIVGLTLVLDGTYTMPCAESGGGLKAEAPYDFKLPYIEPDEQMPMRFTIPLRHEVSAAGTQRLRVTMGPESRESGTFAVRVYAFKLYANIAGDREPLLLGQGKYAEPDAVAEFVQLRAEWDRLNFPGWQDCIATAREKVLALERLPGPNSPEFQTFADELR